MSDSIKHECGIALVRLLKPLDYYHKKYGTALYGLNKLYLLLQKQRNRGQDGAGVATIKLEQPPGKRYISRHRSNKAQPIRKIFDHIHGYFNDLPKHKMNNPAWLKDKKPFMGELLLGHLRYGTHGKNSIENCHPFLRQNNWITRNLVLAGNFNLTNVDELFDILTKLGQHPKEKSDTVTVLEKIGHFLDEEVQRLYDWYKPTGKSREEITKKIIKNIKVSRILKKACYGFDGGYAMAGLLGHGDAFVMRDPSGIRPAFYYADDEVVVVASERPAIQTAFNVLVENLKEIPPGDALIIKKDGQVQLKNILKPNKRSACSFERIYFSRGTDRDIYLERKRLGKQLVKPVLKAINYDFKNTVFSFVPNSAEAAFYGMVIGLEEAMNEYKLKQIKKLGEEAKGKKLKKILSMRPRIEKIVVKDEKLRTFISDDASRGELVSHVYDVTYGIVKNEKDTLVLIDDSIVRGTTLKQSIINIVSRLRPKKIIILSSAPQIRYPDCYGIDMSRMKEFVAFRALVELLKENDKEHLLQETYELCKKELKKPKSKIKNQVKKLYKHFPYKVLTNKIAEIVTPENIKPEVEVIFQSLEGLRRACPHNSGDWYFSGNYPTPGGNRIINQAFINYMENKDVRAY